MKDILNKISKLDLSLGEPIYSLAYRNAKLALEETNPYERISLTLTFVAQLAYATQLHLVRSGKGYVDYLPKHPVEIRVYEGSLPSNMVDILAEKVLSFAEIYVDEIVNELERGFDIYVPHYVSTIPLHTIVMISRKKEMVEEAYSKLMEVLETMRRDADTKEISIGIDITYHDGVPQELRGRGFKAVKLVSGTHRGTDFEKFKRVMSSLGFQLKEGKLGNLRHVYARKMFGDVELFVDCDSKGFGFIIMEFSELLPEVPTVIESPVRIENVLITPLEFTADLKEAGMSIYVRKVQQIGNKLAVYLTEALHDIGVAAGCMVEVVVDRKRREVLIKPLESKQ